MTAERELWHCVQPWLDPRRPVVIDETGTQTEMARLRGRAPCGARLVAPVPHGHRKTDWENDALLSVLPPF